MPGLERLIITYDAEDLLKNGVFSELATKSIELYDTLPVDRKFTEAEMESRMEVRGPY